MLPRVTWIQNLSGLSHTESLSLCGRLLRFRFHQTCDSLKGVTSSHGGIAVIIKMELSDCGEKVRERGDGRTVDRPPLLYGQSVSPRTGTSPVAYCVSSHSGMDQLFPFAPSLYRTTIE